MIAARSWNVLGLALIVGACEPPQAGSHPAAAAGRRASGRAPEFAVASSKGDYARARAGLSAIDAFRGAVMTETLATDLAFKCADLRALQRGLQAERDPLVWSVLSDIDRTCGFDIPLASARFEVERIEKKRAGGADTSVKGECLGLRLAVGDIGQAFLDNPVVIDVGGKFSAYCTDGDTVRRLP